MIWFTSDTHFNHNKEFIWKVRGFNTCDEMNEFIVRRWNEMVQPDSAAQKIVFIILKDLRVIFILSPEIMILINVLKCIKIVGM